jgi:hypothetical protein
VSLDKIKPLKIESLDTGGNSNDEFPTSLDPENDHVECAGIVLDDPGQVDETTVIWRDNTDMKFKDGHNPSGATLTDLLNTGGITPEQHEALRTLTHDVVQDSWDEVLRDLNRRISQVTTWTSQTLPRLKIRDVLLTRGAGNRVTHVVTIQYDVAGAEVYRIIEDLARNTYHLITDITRTRAA